MKITPINLWTYSCDSDFWYQDFYPSKQEAIEAGLEEYPSGCYVGGVIIWISHMMTWILVNM